MNANEVQTGLPKTGHGSGTETRVTGNCRCKELVFTIVVGVVVVVRHSFVWREF